MTNVEISTIFHAPQPITAWVDTVGNALREARSRPGPTRLLPGEVPAVRQAADLLDRYCSDVDPTGASTVPPSISTTTTPSSRPSG